jgi:hypothetical protein
MLFEVIVEKPLRPEARARAKDKAREQEDEDCYCFAMILPSMDL